MMADGNAKGEQRIYGDLSQRPSRGAGPAEAARIPKGSLYHKFNDKCKKWCYHMLCKASREAPGRRALARECLGFLVSMEGAIRRLYINIEFRW